MSDELERESLMIYWRFLMVAKVGFITPLEMLIILMDKRTVMRYSVIW